MTASGNGKFWTSTTTVTDKSVYGDPDSYADARIFYQDITDGDVGLVESFNGCVRDHANNPRQDLESINALFFSRVIDI